MKEKKKFKDTTVGQILLGAAHIVNPSLGNVLEGALSPIDALKKIGDSSIPDESKRSLQELLIDADAKEQDGVTRRWEADAASDSWLSKNVRPLTLVFFSVAYVVGWYMDKDITLVNGLMMLIVGGYFGARATEKVFKMKSNETKTY